jgi:hypothetical protein
MVATLYKVDKQKTSGEPGAFQAVEEELAAMEIPASELAYHPMQRWTSSTMDRGKTMTTLEGAAVGGVLEVPCSAGGGMGMMGGVGLANRMGGSANGMNGDRPEEEDSWFYGFLGLARALHAKDLDNDGFHAMEEVRKLVKSYNLVYKLQLDDHIMDEIILQCSNGVQVDIESLLRMLALEAP